MKLAVSRLMTGLMVAGILGFGTLIQSCSTQSSPLAADNNNQSSELMSKNADFTQYGVEDIYKSSEFDMPENPLGDPNRDSTGNGGGGSGRDSSKGGGPGTGDKGGPRFRPLPFPCLGLDSAQMTQIRQFMKEAEAANKAANEAYRNATAPMREQQKAAMEAYRSATADARQKLQDAQKQYRQEAAKIIADGKAAGKTREEIQAELKALREQFQAQTAELRAQLETAKKALDAALKGIREQMAAAQKALQEALRANQQALNEKIASILTAEQKLIWEQWLAGKDPCKGKGPRG